MTDKDLEQQPEPDAPSEESGNDEEQGKVEKESEESFPASDPPSW